MFVFFMLGELNSAFLSPKKTTRGENMETISYGDFRISDSSASDLRQIDCECAACLYEAGKLAVEDVLAAIINNELTETEKEAVNRYWFEREKISHIAAVNGVSDDSVRKSLKRAQKKIYAGLKYVVLYNSVIGSEDRLPENFRFKIIRCIDGRELIS